MLVAIFFLTSVFADQAYLRIIKNEKIIEVWYKDAQNQYYLSDIYPICAMSGKLGPKTRSGDKQAPEGSYRITKKDLNPYSKYHLSMNVGYPNSYDRSLGRTGSYIMIHGGCKSIGCFAIGDDQIEELYRLVKRSIEKYGYVDVDIYPFRITEENLVLHSDNEWIWFWKQLQKSYLKVSMN